MLSPNSGSYSGGQTKIVPFVYEITLFDWMMSPSNPCVKCVYHPQRSNLKNGIPPLPSVLQQIQTAICIFPQSISKNFSLVDFNNHRKTHQNCSQGVSFQTRRDFSRIISYTFNNIQKSG